MHLERRVSNNLKTWLFSSHRKPLVLRGARQVGKTFSVRALARAEAKVLVECNFEKSSDLISLFNDNDPHKIFQRLRSYFGFTASSEDAVLFLDEIQAAPIVLSKLRWFAEEMPELAVIAAGSLLEFMLADYPYSMPVGRIQYYHLEPLSFEEFLLAKGQSGLLDYISKYRWEEVVPEAIHTKLMKLFKEYVLIGGLPAAVSAWVETNSFEKVGQIHSDLMGTYTDDFSRYSGKLSTAYLHAVLKAVPRCLGQKFVYSAIDKEAKSAPLKQALNLIAMSRVCHRVESTAVNGVPLASEVNEKFFKMILIDTGLVNNALGLQLHQLESIQDLNLVHQGGLSEQVVGQLLRTLSPYYVKPELHYWVREVKGSNAEIDFVIQYQHHVVPIEVKSGSTGSLKSLHQFMASKNLPFAVRINSDIPSLTMVDLKNTQGQPVNYKLLSIPFYLVEQCYRLIDQVI